MKLIDGSLKNSTAVIVGMILTVLFGGIALKRIPVQLNPTIERPFITVETLYPGASATEVEQEITLKQEEKLASVENLREMRSTSREGTSEIVLQFDWGINKDLAALDVNKKLQLVEELPDDAEEPQIQTVNRQEEEIVLWTYLTTDQGLTINQMRRTTDDVIMPALERVKDVAGVRRFGGAEREIHVLVDPQSITARDLTLAEISEALYRENRNLRGGKIDQGGRRLIVRTLGQYTNLEQIRESIVKDTPSGPIRIRDIAQVRDGTKDVEVLVRVNGDPSIAMGLAKKSGANTLEVAEGAKEEIAKLNRMLEPRGIKINQAYDSSDYIWDSILGF